MPRLHISAQLFAQDGLVHGDQIVGRYIGHHIVDGVEDEAAILVQNADTLGYLLPYLLGCAEGQYMLGIHAAAPEGELVTVALLQLLGADALGLHGAELNGIQTIHAHLVQIVQQGIDAAAGVVEGLPAGVLMDPIVHLPVVGLVKGTEGIGMDKGACLGGKVGAGNVDGLDPVAHGLLIDLQVLESDLGLQREWRYCDRFL